MFGMLFICENMELFCIPVQSTEKCCSIPSIDSPLEISENSTGDIQVLVEWKAPAEKRSSYGGSNIFCHLRGNM